MRKELTKLVRTTFEDALARSLPAFKKTRVRDQDGTETYYKMEAFAGGGIYLLLEPDPNEDSFSITVYCRIDDALPFDNFTTSPESADLGRDRIIFPLDTLWTKKGRAFVVSKSPSFEEEMQALNKGEWPVKGEPVDVAKQRIPAVVDDAIGKLQEYGVPFFEKLMSRHGDKGRSEPPPTGAREKKKKAASAKQDPG